jgi:sialic acid synthase SpsE
MGDTRIICDIGHNWQVGHDSPARGEALIEAAVEAGAFGVILHLFSADKIYRDRDLIDKVSPYDVSESMFSHFAHSAARKGIAVFASCHYPEAVAIAEKHNVFGYHISNGTLRYDDIVKAVAATGKRTLIACGLYLYSEMELPLELFDKKEVVLMHSSGLYPTPINEVQLSSFLDMMEKYVQEEYEYLGIESTTELKELDFIMLGYMPDVLVRKIDLEDGRGIESQWSVHADHIKTLVAMAAVVKLAMHADHEFENLSKADIESRNRLLRDPDDFLLPCRCGDKNYE